MEKAIAEALVNKILENTIDNNGYKQASILEVAIRSYMDDYIRSSKINDEIVLKTIEKIDLDSLTDRLVARLEETLVTANTTPYFKFSNSDERNAVQKIWDIVNSKVADILVKEKLSEIKDNTK